MHARAQAIGAVTALLLVLGTGAIGEDSQSSEVILDQPATESPIISDSVSQSDNATQYSVDESQVSLSPTLVHIGCPSGFEALYMTTPFMMDHPDGSKTNYWPTCEWFHDSREFPGCPTYGTDVWYPPICMQHRNQND